MKFAGWIIAVVLLQSSAAVEYDGKVENTNFLLRQPNIYDTTAYLYDYNRFRIQGNVNNDLFFASATADWVGYLGHDFINSFDFNLSDRLRADIPFDVRSRTWKGYSGATHLRIQRLYGGYEDDVQRITVGIQRVSMGVGRIWTPTDLFNPKNSYALEPDEVFGVLAVQYTYAPSDLSSLQAVVSIRNDRTMKYAGRFKGYLSFADVGIDLIHSDATDMIGYELEGNLFGTGAEWRAEGGWFKNDLNATETAEFFQGIIGVDYGFENGITWVVEALYSSTIFDLNEILDFYDSDIISNMAQSHVYAGTTLSYDFSIAISGSLLYIESFNDANSRFVAPSLNYSLGDHHTFACGAMLNHGPKQSDFGKFAQTYYLKWSFTY